MISIITAYYNRKVLFERTLKSIGNSKFKGKFEVIAVDDGSVDNERIEDLCELYPFLKVIRLDPQKKWYSNSCIPFNIGFSYAKGEKIIIQNPECFHLGDILNNVDKNLNKGTYISYSCFSLDKSTTNDLLLHQNCTTFKEVIDKYNYHVRNDGDFGWYNHSVYRPHGFHFCNAIHKADLVKLNGFDERFALGIAYDDDEFVYRAKNLLKLIFEDNEIVLHQNHYSPTSLSYENRLNKQKLLDYNKSIYLNRINAINFNKLFRIFPFTYRKYVIRVVNFLEGLVRKVINKIA